MIVVSVFSVSELAVLVEESLYCSLSSLFPPEISVTEFVINLFI